MDTRNLAELPDAVSFAQAATLPVAGVTALRALEICGRHTAATEMRRAGAPLADGRKLAKAIGQAGVGVRGRSISHRKHV